MKREINTYTLPEYSLPYIINGTKDNLTDEEINEIDKFLSVLNQPLFGDISEPFFVCYNDMHNKRLGMNCVEIEISEITKQ